MSDTFRSFSRQVYTPPGKMAALRATDPRLLEAFLKAVQAEITPEQASAIALGSAYRTPAHQARLHQRSLRGGPLAAPPGRSQHNFGRAIDIMPRGGWNASTPAYQAALKKLQEVGPRYGFLNPPGIRDRDGVHFQLSTKQSPMARNSAMSKALETEKSPAPKGAAQEWKSVTTVTPATERKKTWADLEMDRMHGMESNPNEMVLTDSAFLGFSPKGDAKYEDFMGALLGTKDKPGAIGGLIGSVGKIFG